MKQLNQILIARSVYFFSYYEHFIYIYVSLTTYIDFSSHNTISLLFSFWLKNTINRKSKTQLVVHLYGILNDVPVGSKQQ